MDDLERDATLSEIQNELKHIKRTLDGKPGWAGITGLMVGVLALVLGGYTALMLVIAETKLDAAALRAAQDLDDRIDELEGTIEDLKSEVIAYSSNVDTLVRIIDVPRTSSLSQDDAYQALRRQELQASQLQIPFFEPETMQSGYDFTDGFLAISPVELQRLQMSFASGCIEFANASARLDLYDAYTVGHNGFFQGVPQDLDINFFIPAQLIYDRSGRETINNLFNRSASEVELSDFQSSMCLREALLEYVLSDRLVERDDVTVRFDETLGIYRIETELEPIRGRYSVDLENGERFYMVPVSFLE